MDSWLDSLLSIIAPHMCKGCDWLGATLCRRCIFNIVSRKYDRCINCSCQVSPADFAKRGSLCSACAKVLPFARIFVVGERRGALLKLVGDFKYNGERASARVIAKLLDATIPPLTNDVIITAIPTAPPHVRQRGFDHAELIARWFAKMRRRKFAKLLRRETNQSQHDLGARDRRILAAKMFSSRETAPARILLIDDIWTTGATTTAAAKLLRKSGAREVDLAIVARQVGVHRARKI